MKSNFHKNDLTKVGCRSACKSCEKKYYSDNRNRLINKENFYNKEHSDRIKKYQIKNHDEIIAQQRIYSHNKYKSDIKFRLICKTRSRICKALQGKIKLSSTSDILGIDIDLNRNWIEYQMTPERNLSNIEIDHVKAICLFDVSKDEK